MPDLPERLDQVDHLRLENQQLKATLAQRAAVESSAKLEAIKAEITAKYQIGARDTVSLDTGAIARHPESAEG